MPYDPALAERMRDALSGRNRIRETKMFGGICWTLDGNMLCGVEKDRFMFLRFCAARRRASLRQLQRGRDQIAGLLPKVRRQAARAVRDHRQIPTMRRGTS